jgi:uncharacterized protein (TIGR03435 family)
MRPTQWSTAATMGKKTGRATIDLLVAAVMFVATSCAAHSQGCAGASNADAKLPQFDVATIKPFDKSYFIGILTYPGGRVAGGHLNLRDLLMYACGAQTYQVVGGPAWADADYYNIEAKPPDSSPSVRLNPASPKLPMNEEQRQMLLALLIDRFQLKFHVESREGPVYLLERGTGDPKLDPPKDPNVFPWVGGLEGGAITWGTGMAGQNISMPLLAERLSRYFERPIIDKTGIAGSFDFKFRTNELDPTVPVTRDDVINSIFASIKGIGLKLVPAKAPIETIVIDHAEQPSPN